MQEQEFYSTAQPTHDNAMLGAQKIVAILYEERVLTEHVGFPCIPKSSCDQEP
jgi:hypothetical protein